MKKKTLRVSYDSKVLGVCGGLSEYFEVDPVFVRLAFLIFLFAGGSALLVYLCLYCVMGEAIDASYW